MKRSPAAADQPLDFGSTRHDNIPFLGHFKNQFDLNDATTLEVGASYLTGAAPTSSNTPRSAPTSRFATCRRRIRIDAAGSCRASTSRRVRPRAASYTKSRTAGTRRSSTAVSQVWWAGVRGEQARDSFTDFVVDAAGNPLAGNVTRGSVNLAWMPSEFSFVRLEYSHANADAGVHPTDDRIMLQLSYTIGYHPAHAY